MNRQKKDLRKANNVVKIVISLFILLLYFTGLITGFMAWILSLLAVAALILALLQAWVSRYPTD